MASGMEEASWVWLIWAEGSCPRSSTGISGDSGWLKTSKSSSESKTLTISSSSSSLIVGWEGVTSPSAVN